MQNPSDSKLYRPVVVTTCRGPAETSSDGFSHTTVHVWPQGYQMVCMYIYYIYLSVYLSIYPSIYLPIYLYYMCTCAQAMCIHIYMYKYIYRYRYSYIDIDIDICVCIYIYIYIYVYMCVCDKHWKTRYINYYKFKVYTVLIWRTFSHIAKLQKYFLRPWPCVKVFVDVTEILLGVAGDGQGTKIGNKN